MMSVNVPPRSIQNCQRCTVLTSLLVELTCDILSLRQRAQDVFTSEQLQIRIAPAATNELSKQQRITGHVLESDGPVGVAVIVAAEADVLDAGDFANVLDVIGDH